MSKQNDKSDLGYLGEDFQYRLVHAFVEDKDFFKDLSSVIDQNMFTNPRLKQYVGIMKETYETRGSVPTYRGMETLMLERARNESDRLYCIETSQKIETIEDGDAELTKEAAMKFFKQQNIIKTANEILRIAGDGSHTQYERCVELLQEALNKGVHEDMGTSVFDNMAETLSQDYRTPIPTGIKALDESLEGGIGKGELGVIIGSSSFGKAQPLYSKILTPNGWKRMGDMKVGDMVIGGDGKPHRVSGVFPQGKRPIYRLHFENFKQCECDIEHLWTVIDKDGNRFTKTLREIRNDCIKCYGKSVGETETVYASSYLLDMFLDYEFPILENAELAKNKVDMHEMHKLRSLSKNDCLATIDESSIFNSHHVRQLALNELLNNGDISYKTENGKNTIFVSASQRLIKKLNLLLSLEGLSADVHAFIPDDGIVKLQFGTQNLSISNLENAALYYGLDVNLEERKTTHKLDSIVYVGEEEAQCIMVDSEDHLYVTDDCIVTHNTSMTTAIASHAATYKCEQNNDKGFKVLQIVFEDRIKQIQRKHLGRISHVEARDLSKDEYKEQVRKAIEEYADRELLEKNLRIVRFPSGEYTAAQIGRYIKKLINNGFKPDLVILDYFECLVHVGDGTTSNEYEKEGKTMRKLEALAGELDIAFWIPTQGTKESVGLELVTMDKAGGSFKKIQIAHIVVSIARTMEDIDMNKATIALLKNRAGKAGRVLNNVEFNNGTCIISTDNCDSFDNMTTYNKNQSQVTQDVLKKIMKDVEKKSK